MCTPANVSGIFLVTIYALREALDDGCLANPGGTVSDGIMV
jgi:hypothetical protein